MPNQSIPNGYRGSNGRVYAPDEYHAIECSCENVKKPLEGADHHCGRELWRWTDVRMVLISAEMEHIERERVANAERERIRAEFAAERLANPPPPPITPAEFRRQLNPNGPTGELSDYLVLLTDVAITPPPPAAYMRSDGATLLPEGKLSSFYGMPDVCKSWLALDAARAVTRNGGRVVFWDHEDTKETLLRRAEAIGYGIEDGLDRLAYLPPSLSDDPVAIKQAALWVKQGDATGLVVIDACNSAGCPSDGSNVMPWFTSHVAPWGKDVTILLLDHIPKRSDDRAPGAIGSVHKTSMLTGVALLIEGKPWTRKADGRVTLTNQKDRDSVLPAGRFQRVAAITGTHIDDVLVLRADAPNNADSGLSLRDRIVNAITVAEPKGIRTVAALMTAVGGKSTKVRPEINTLVEFGVIEVTKDGKADVFRLAREMDGER